MTTPLLKPTEENLKLANRFHLIVVVLVTVTVLGAPFLLFYS